MLAWIYYHNQDLKQARMYALMSLLRQNKKIRTGNYGPLLGNGL